MRDALEVIAGSEYGQLIAPPDADAPLSVVDLLRRVYVGDRFPTGLAALDERLKGGLAPGFLFVIGGEPWIGKTTLLVQIADALAADGVAVFIWAADEPPEGLALRLGQLHGEEQHELNPNYPPVLARLAGELSNGPRFLPESVETVEQAADFVERHTPDGRVGALLLDSLQSQSERSGDDADSPRAALSGLMAELVEAKKRGLIVGAVSELARGAYASPDPGQRTRGLAAFAESRAIEYRSDIAMIMTSDGGGNVRLEVVKNRLGHLKGGLTLKLNHARARFGAIADEVLKRQADDERQRVEQERLRADEDRVAGVLEKAERGLTKDEIRDRARMKKQAVGEALVRMEDDRPPRVRRFKPPREPKQSGPVPERFELPRGLGV
ncbi:MAG TPA: DnaB-like helicase C-terminal domain-containing protein [Thermoanaerobaculia bacterium]|nr:DnaB-like helicase C-terminal domain-containing protein [Thermoanaerobaculia bacterium]